MASVCQNDATGQRKSSSVRRSAAGLTLLRHCPQRPSCRCTYFSHPPYFAYDRVLPDPKPNLNSNLNLNPNQKL